MNGLQISYKTSILIEFMKLEIECVSGQAELCQYDHYIMSQNVNTYLVVCR